MAFTRHCAGLRFIPLALFLGVVPCAKRQTTTSQDGEYVTMFNPLHPPSSIPWIPRHHRLMKTQNRPGTAAYSILTCSSPRPQKSTKPRCYRRHTPFSFLSKARPRGSEPCVPRSLVAPVAPRLLCWFLISAASSSPYAPARKRPVPISRALRRRIPVHVKLPSEWGSTMRPPYLFH
jgi:hypothetical protein